jgi:alkylhydroperoxidase family enzyme
VTVPSPPPARVSLVGLHPSEPVVARVFDRIRGRRPEPLNMHRALARSPRIFEAYVGLAYSLRDEAKASRDARELVILRIVHRAGGEYELAQHRSMALRSGVTASQVEAVEHWQDSDVFDERQRALLAYADELISADSVSDRTFDALAQHFDEQEIVELTITGAFYSAAAIVTRALRIRIEPDLGDDAIQNHPDQPKPTSGRSPGG